MNKHNVSRLTFIIVLVSFLLSTFVSLWSLSIMSQRNDRELNKMMAARIYDAISSELSEPVTVALTMANDSFLIKALQNEQDLPEEEVVTAMQNYLAGIQKGLNYESVYVISESSRRYYNFDGLSKIVDPDNDEHDSWYGVFLTRKPVYDLDVGFDEQSGDMWTVFVDASIRDGQGNFLGVCGVGVHMYQSQALFMSLEKEHRVKINLIDADGQIQIDTDEGSLMGKYHTDLNLSPSGEYIYHDLGGGHIAVSKYVDNLEWYLVVESDSSPEQSEYFNVILLNVALCLFVMVILIVALRIISMRTTALTNASLRDQDTQLLNRRAFEEEKARLSMSALDENYVYVTVDINGLKTANDTLGHAAGDELILGTADCLRKCFGSYGKIYRIGGDEFAVMLHIGEAQLDELREELEKLVAEWSGERIKQLSVSCGYASTREFPSENFAQLSRISDERMYAAKAEYYRRNGIERRRT
ncbi:MAG: GGDEF domain-containing protein [Clostridia bacterium]|nr:GGDEF domain-containing protein [Clostridia bacterium]